MADIHGWFGWVVVAVNAVVGLWALGAHWATGLRRNELWWAAGAAHAAVGVQILLGVLIVAGDDVEANDLHMFYGFLGLVAVAVIVSYRHLSAYRYLIYGLGGLFIMGLGIRAATLDPLAV